MSGDGYGIWHVTPINDLIEHEDSADCVCGPDQDTECARLYIHNSLDRREERE